MPPKPHVKTQFVNTTAKEIVASTPETRASVHYYLRKGKLRKIARGLYTTNLTDSLENIVRRNMWQIAAHFFPGAVIADRTAIESRSAPDGSVFLVAERGRALSLPGVNFWPRRGPGPVPESDRPFIDGLFMSSQARALLDNLHSSRKRRHLPRTLRQEGVEHYLEKVLRNAGDAAVNRLRNEAKQIASLIGREKEGARLSQIIGAMMGTQSAKLKSPAAIARGKGDGYDPDRVQLFELLRADLASQPFPERIPSKDTQYLPFFEAYFSNFIEGTEFEVGEAYKIVYEGEIPAGRPEDAHDVIGTFNIVADSVERARTATTANEFLDLLRARHAALLGGRSEKRPGQFKTKSNKVGSTIFVAPELVRGTLKRGFELLATLQFPMAKAIFATFLVSEVHPFDDGNGRLARIALNAHLSAGNQARIIIPTVFRTEYLQALRALSHNHNTQSLIRVLDFAQKYVQEIDFTSYEGARLQLVKTNAFSDPADALGDSPKLILPSRL
jgi:fido (protein-threonine AMPylation protein)